MTKQDTITFQPTTVNRRALDAKLGIQRDINGKIIGKRKRGEQTQLINACLALHLSKILPPNQDSVGASVAATPQG